MQDTAYAISAVITMLITISIDMMSRLVVAATIRRSPLLSDASPIGGSVNFLGNGVGWVLAVASIGAGAYYFAYGKRRRKLEISALKASLITATARRENNLKVSFNEHHVGDPNIVTIKITNIGPKDIASKDFDAEKPVKIGLGALVVSRLQMHDNEIANFSEISEDSRHLLINPGKIAAGKTYSLRLLVDGDPRFELVDNPLIDTDVINAQSEATREIGRVKKILKALPILLAVLFIPSIGYLVYETFHLGSEDKSLLRDLAHGQPWVIAGFGIVLAGLLVILFFSAYSLIRLNRITSSFRRIVEN